MISLKWRTFIKFSCDIQLVDSCWAIRVLSFGVLRVMENEVKPLELFFYFGVKMQFQTLNNEVLKALVLRYFRRMTQKKGFKHLVLSSKGF